MESKFLNREEAAQYLTDCRGLKVSKNTLQKLVTVGGGPAYRRFGKRAVYQIVDLNAWAESKLSTLRCSSSFTGTGVVEQRQLDRVQS